MSGSKARPGRTIPSPNPGAPEPSGRPFTYPESTGIIRPLLAAGRPIISRRRSYDRVAAGG